VAALPSALVAAAGIDVSSSGKKLRTNQTSQERKLMQPSVSTCIEDGRSQAITGQSCMPLFGQVSLPGMDADKPALAQEAQEAQEEQQALCVREQPQQQQQQRWRQQQQYPLDKRGSSCSKPPQPKLLTDSDEEMLDLILDERLML
jgi:FtsZ-binding cell division protein ZapB